MTEPAPQKTTGRASLWIKLQTGLLAAVLALLVVLTCVVGVTARRMEKSLALVQTDLEALEMSQVNQAVEALTEAARQLAAVDVEGLNEAAQSLKAAAASRARLRRWDAWRWTRPRRQSGDCRAGRGRSQAPSATAGEVAAAFPAY